MADSTIHDLYQAQATEPCYTESRIHSSHQQDDSCDYQDAPPRNRPHEIFPYISTTKDHAPKPTHESLSHSLLPPPRPTSPPPIPIPIRRIISSITTLSITITISQTSLPSPLKPHYIIHPCIPISNFTQKPSKISKNNRLRKIFKQTRR